MDAPLNDPLSPRLGTRLEVDEVAVFENGAFVHGFAVDERGHVAGDLHLVGESESYLLDGNEFTLVKRELDRLYVFSQVAVRFPFDLYCSCEFHGSSLS